ncbi:hypothetical protein J40TS1_06420 [Paenibacillus montaniterrae]|uniref:Uncharacterized protein n=1 Tax=Paenibacillus montaniterrae TaxID=429341 RepID=A0A919YKA2_9BACL|nr:hypothetical protein J40TS1_06420 [Paenibacillus montaniterrae]
MLIDSIKSINLAAHTKKILGRAFLTIPFKKEIVYNNIVKINNGVVALNEANEAYKAIFQARHT